MGETFCLQPISSFSGTKSTTVATENRDLNQPVPGWLDAKDYRDATFHVQILRCEQAGTGGKVKLAIQTATAAAGPWTLLEEYDDTFTPFPVNASFAASTGGAASKQLERFVRWSVDTSALANTDTWTLCFGICVTLK